LNTIEIKKHSPNAEVVIESGCVQNLVQVAGRKPIHYHEGTSPKTTINVSTPQQKFSAVQMVMKWLARMRI
jgi:hypothetical protein